MTDACNGTCPLASPPMTITTTGWTLRMLFDTAGFPDRWHCGRWSAGLGWLHITSDLAIFAAYLSIPLALACFLARRRNVPFPRLIALFAAFVLSCGIGHAIEALIFWHPVYRLGGVVKAVTAVISWVTVLAMIRVIPAALRLPDLARSEESLRESAERFALAVRGTDHGIWDWDVATGSVYYSARFQELLGHEDEFESTLEAWESRVHPEDHDRAMAAIAAHFEGRSPYDVEYRLRTRVGEYRWFHARGQATWDDAGRATRMAGSITDVSQRRCQEAVIAEQVRLAEFGRDIALVLAKDSTMPEMLARCAEITVARVDAAFSRIWTVDESGEILELQASAGMYTHLDGPHGRIPVGRYKIGRIAEERQPHLTNSVLGDPLVPEQEWAEREGMIAFAGYPLVVGDRLVGVWALFARHALSDSTLTAMESVASGIALGIERKRSETALLRSEAEARKLALIASRTDNAVILTDPAGRIEWVNPGFTRITGYEPDEAVGRTPGSLLQGPNTDPAAATYMRERQRSGEGFRVEVVNYAKDGREYWISVEAQPIRGDDGRLAHFMAIESDITERKRAEEQLTAAHRERRDIMEAVPDLLFVLDREGRLLRWNRRTEAATGLSADELAGRPAAEFFPVAQRASIAEAIGRCYEAGYAEVEADVLGRDGSATACHFVAAPLKDGDGNLIGVAGLGRDITERKRIDQQLRMLQAAIENANDAILITEAEPIDQPGPRVVYANAAFARTTGYAPEEIIGKTPRILQGPGTDRATLDELRKKLKRWKPVRVELLNYAKDGREFWVELNIRPVADATGYFTHWVSIQRDITARKLAEQRKQIQSEVEVRDLNFQLEQRILRLDSLRQIDLAISSSLDLQLTLGIVIDQVLARLKVDAAAILLIGRHDQVVTYAAGKGFRTDAIAATNLRPGEGHAGRAVLEQRHVFVPDLARADGPSPHAVPLENEGFFAYHAVPLVAKGQVRGVLEIYHRSPMEPDRDWTAFLDALAGQAAIAIDNAALFHDLQRSHAGLIAAYDATIEGWARALDLRDKETEGHTRRVTEMTVRLARSMGVDEPDLLAIRRGSLLHDIGKLGIPDDILLKPGKLTEDEWKVMRRHPEYAFEWLAPIATLRPALDIPHHHHEKWDGTGYPHGLAGQQIPLPARIFAAVDIWDALRSDRPYREGWPERRVIEHIRSLSGTHLDPAVVEAFLLMIDNEASHAGASSDGRAAQRVSIGAGRGPGSEAVAMAAEWESRLTSAEESLRRSEARRDQQAIEISRLSRLSLTDDLTGLNNRRHFREALDVAFSLANREGRPLSVLMLDVDLFKLYNDDHGHQAGDHVLRTLAEILREEIRPHDLIARHGGEEFIVLLPDADADAGRAVAERLRAAIAGHGWPLSGVTASFGVATTSPAILAAAELIEAADKALYLSKRRGRDRVTHSEDLHDIKIDSRPRLSTMEAFS